MWAPRVMDLDRIRETPGLEGLGNRCDARRPSDPRDQTSRTMPRTTKNIPARPSSA